MLKKWLLLLFYMLLAVLIYQYGDHLIAWMQETSNISLITVTAVVMALFPVIPYPAVGAAIGAALGPGLGGLVTWIGSSAASILMFLFVRYLFPHWGERILRRYKRIKWLTERFERNAFLAIMFARLLPFVPSMIVNVYAAFSRVSFPVYALASSIGKVPAMLLFAMVGNQVIRDPKQIILTLIVYGAFLIVSMCGYTLWMRWHKRETPHETGK